MLFQSFILVFSVLGYCLGIYYFFMAWNTVGGTFDGEFNNDDAIESETERILSELNELKK